MRELRSTPPALIICVAALPPQPPVVPADLTPPPPPIYTLPSPPPPHAIAIQQADLSTLLVFFLLSPRALKMMPHQSTSLDLGLSLGGLASQGSLSSSTTTTSGAISPWAAALTSVVGDVTARRDAHTHAPQHLQAAMDPDHRGAMRASTSPDSAAALSSGASGGDNTSNSKRDRDLLERTGSGGVRSDEEDAADGAGGRKKLRLSKDQAAVLEECFKTHSTLNPKQKVALANRLGLRPRQVEVWFQNRRARTKLKQTEVDCEYLKRWCERLADENKRLEKELADLRALKAAAPSAAAAAAQPASASPAATLTMCPSCRRVAAANHHHQQQQQCHPKSSNAPTPAVAGGGVVPSHCQFFPAAVDRTGQSTWNAAAAPLVTRELF